MASYYDVPIHWKTGKSTKGRGIGNNAAWQCSCKQILLGLHEDCFPIDACPECGRRFRIVRGKKPHYVDHVEEIE